MIIHTFTKKIPCAMCNRGQQAVGILYRIYHYYFKRSLDVEQYSKGYPIPEDCVLHMVWWECILVNSERRTPNESSNGQLHMRYVMSLHRIHVNTRSLWTTVYKLSPQPLVRERLTCCLQQNNGHEASLRTHVRKYPMGNTIGLRIARCLVD